MTRQAQGASGNFFIHEYQRKRITYGSDCSVFNAVKVLLASVLMLMKLKVTLCSQCNFTLNAENC